jgi:hypothetical protein
MQRIDLDYWYTFGRAMSLLEECFAVTPCNLDSRDWSRIKTAVSWLGPIATGKLALLSGTKAAAAELIALLAPLLEGHRNTPEATVDPLSQAKIYTLITAFHNSMRSGAQDAYVFLVSGIGAYSATALISDATSHLSELVQQTLDKAEKQDFVVAGACLACAFPTASGFHSMRAMEAEARRYHKFVTGAAIQVEWTLDSLINGNSGKGRFGLRDQWKKEGARDDSQLLLIISLLSSINQIYRNPIMHPEMTLDSGQAKKVFDTAALAISSMVEDRKERELQVASKPIT